MRIQFHNVFVTFVTCWPWYFWCQVYKILIVDFPQVELHTAYKSLKNALKEAQNNEVELQTH